MKLLVFTQKVDINDDVLGFFHDWATEFAKHVEQLTIICLFEGKHELPANVKVLSLGKENNYKLQITNYELIKKVLYITRFYKFILRELRSYDAIFAHMNYEYILLGGPIWRLTGKKIGLWFAHGSTSLGLRIASLMSHIIFTSTNSGYRLKSHKLKVVGQGIDTEKFKPDEARKKIPGEFKIITVGRISPSKDIETLVKAIENLKNNQEFKLSVEIVGGAGLAEQEEYFTNIKSLVKEKNLDNIIKFVGPVPNREILRYLQKADLFVNMSHTGSLDKAMLEAMAVGLPVISCNEAMLEVLGEHKERLMYSKKDANGLAEKIKSLIDLSTQDFNKISADMREIVVRDHSLPGLIGKIIEQYKI